MVKDDIADYLEANLNLYAEIQMNTLGDSNAIAIMDVPSAPVGRHLDGGKDDVYQFLVKTSHSNQFTAQQTIQEITNTLDMTEGVILRDAELTKIEVYTNPSFLEKTAKNTFIYVAQFRAEYYIRGN